MLYDASVKSYISETVHPEIRGSLVTMSGFSMAAGMLSTWILGYFLNWRMIAYLQVIPQVFLIMFMILLPETPYWLIEHGFVHRAQRSLQLFRGKSYDVSGELNEIKQKHNTKKMQSNKNTWKSMMNGIFSTPFIKPFSCVGILYFMDAWSGFNPLLTYTFEILEKAGSNIDSGLVLIIVGSIRFAFAGM